MSLINEHYLKLTKSYLFADVAKKVNAYKATHPKADVINLGIGDVTRPLCPAVVEAMQTAAAEMGTPEGFRGYGPEQGYAFLREAIVKNDYLPRGVHLDASEIFVNDGAKGDTGNIGELVRWDNSIGVTDPTYPVYIESNVMCGRAGTLDGGRWSNVTYLRCTEENNFTPRLPDHRVDLIYLCSPNNPTGTALTKDELRKWVAYAAKNDALIFYDAAYEAFIRDPSLPHSIYEIKGAKKVAVEFRSYSKTAGFTGVRCGYTVVPRELTASSMDGTKRYPLNEMWLRRLSTKSNGTSYISQRAAEAVYSPEGKAQVKETIDRYLDNAATMKAALKRLGLKAYGGDNSPYLWVKIPGEAGSLKFFERMLYGAQVVCTPGAGFGPGGEGYVRLSSFAGKAACEEAMRRIGAWMAR